MLAIIVAALLVRESPVTTVAGRNGFYVWQRQWTAPVESAVGSELAAGTHDLYVLAGEFECGNGSMRFRGAEVPKSVWRQSRVTAVFRLPVGALDEAERAASEVVAHARELGVCRIQLDVDVPESRIACYAGIVEGVRRLWGGSQVRLTLGATFLPCHLGLSEVRRVLASIDEPVIQLHGIDAPRKRSDAWCLMDRATVFRALRRARTLDCRFKMALPSYAYVLEFDADGAFRRLYAEGLSDGSVLSPGSSRELAAPDLRLLREIFASPLRLPVIWFRLPVSGADRWCLERETLSLLERGGRPIPAVELTARDGGRPGVIDVFARYRHRIPLEGATVSVDWGGCGMEGEFFPLNGCRVAGDVPHGRLPSAIRLAPFACGETFAVAKVIAAVDVAGIAFEEVKEEK